MTDEGLAKTFAVTPALKQWLVDHGWANPDGIDAAADDAVRRVALEVIAKDDRLDPETFAELVTGDKATEAAAASSVAR